MPGSTPTTLGSGSAGPLPALAAGALARTLPLTIPRTTLISSLLGAMSCRTCSIHRRGLTAMLLRLRTTREPPLRCCLACRQT